jgi:hypothetical protein
MRLVDDQGKVLPNNGTAVGDLQVRCLLKKHKENSKNDSCAAADA